MDAKFILIFLFVAALSLGKIEECSSEWTKKRKKNGYSRLVHGTYRTNNGFQHFATKKCHNNSVLGRASMRGLVHVYVNNQVSWSHSVCLFECVLANAYRLLLHQITHTADPKTNVHVHTSANMCHNKHSLINDPDSLLQGLRSQAADYLYICSVYTSQQNETWFK